MYIQNDLDYQCTGAGCPTVSITTSFELTVQISCAEADITISSDMTPVDSYKYYIGYATYPQYFYKDEFTSTAIESPCPSMGYWITDLDGNPYDPTLFSMSFYSTYLRFNTYTNDVTRGGW